MRYHYLDNYAESGSIEILKQLGVSTVNSVGKKASKNDSAWNAEHLFSTEVSYHCTEGELEVDLRDSADCWLRCFVTKGESLTVPAQLYHRVQFLSAGEAKFTTNAPAECTYRFSKSSDSVVLNTYHQKRELVCEICNLFFRSGWVTGTGGSISIRHGNRVYMTPSGVQKERIVPDELFVLDTHGNKLSTPAQKPGTSRAPVLSDCAQLFLHAFVQRNAGAVLHSHGISCALATCLYEGQTEFRISHQEMIKGIVGHGYFDTLVVPIIENTAFEHELSDCLGATIAKYPKAVAVLVRRHGMYVWGDTWEAAKRHAECLHYLFDVAVNMRRMGIDLLKPPPPVTLALPPTQSQAQGPVGELNLGKHLKGVRHLVFDIEGTTTPITFVKDVLFPFASNNVETYLASTWASDKTKADVRALKEYADSTAADKKRTSSMVDSVDSTSPKSLAAFVQHLIAMDLKVGALKQLQGHMWDGGYSSGQLRSIVYDDVPTFFQQVCQHNRTADGNSIQINIYSSGSREAQRLLFKHTNHGDLRECISCYFDTKCGHKRESASYADIALSLGMDDYSQILFVTDIYEEAVAADAAGYKVLIALRPGNAALPTNNKFTTISSFAEF